MQHWQCTVHLWSNMCIIFFFFFQDESFKSYKTQRSAFQTRLPCGKSIKLTLCDFVCSVRYLFGTNYWSASNLSARALMGIGSMSLILCIPYKEYPKCSNMHVQSLFSTKGKCRHWALPHHPMPFVLFVLICDAWEICLMFCKQRCQE